MANIKKTIEMPPSSTYGAVELKKFIQRFTVRGFAITLGIMILLILAYTFQQAIAKKNADLLKGAPVASKIDLMAPPPSDEADNTPPPQTPQVINYGIEARAGSPVPVPEAQIRADLGDFADVKDLDKAMSTTGNVDISKLPDFNIENVDKDKQNYQKEDYPAEDAFIPVEKEPYIDLAELQKKVVYPEMARRANIEGKVTIRVLVDKNGKPKKTIIQQSDSKMLDQAAVEAVMKSVFTPAIQNQQPITCWVSIPILFKLR